MGSNTEEFWGCPGHLGRTSGCHSGHLKGTFMGKKILPQEGFLRDQPAEQLVYSAGSTSPCRTGCLTNPSHTSGNLSSRWRGRCEPRCQCHLMSNGVCRWFPHRGLAQAFSAQRSLKEACENKASTLPTPPGRGHPRRRGAWARVAGTTCCYGSHIVFPGKSS